LLRGSTRIPANPSSTFTSPTALENQRIRKRALSLFASGQYLQARELFRQAASLTQRGLRPGDTAMNWNNAGVCSLVTQQFASSRAEFEKARAIALENSEYEPLAFSLNAMTSLYIHMGQPERAILYAREALDGPAANVTPLLHAKLLYNLALAELLLDRFREARPLYEEAVSIFNDQGDLESSARAWGAIGSEYLRTSQLGEAELALNEALRIARTHRLEKTTANILSGLAKLKERQGEDHSARMLFEAALKAPAGTAPRWNIYSDRGQFRANAGDLEGSVSDFREARQIVAEIRADMVPADRDRVALESGLSMVFDGFVNSGNRLARQTGNKALLRETFDAAEQGRMWSLRALVPSSNDWRTKLPVAYWECLGRYQALGGATSGTTPDQQQKAAALRQELQTMEATAAGSSVADTQESPLAHIRKLLDRDTVLLSFHISSVSSWIWAVDQNSIEAFPLPRIEVLRGEVTAFNQALRAGKPVQEAGSKLYRDLFGMLPERFLRHRHWRIEPDGPLYELPFAALVTGEDSHGPVYLIEKADLESIPGALLANRNTIAAGGGFLGVGDPVYNTADQRYRGERGKTALSLVRLPNTSPELEACARAWNAPAPRLLTGADASIDSVRTALRSSPAILHFATHVISEKANFRSGLIALSLNSKGEMGLLGPQEIVARAGGAKLVVMDGCYSGQGQALPSSGLMGLTRAWLGAGAEAVIATQWDVPDDAGELLMADFYRYLRKAPEAGAAAALRSAQLATLGNAEHRRAPARWAGYFLLSRML